MNTDRAETFVANASNPRSSTIVDSVYDLKNNQRHSEQLVLILVSLLTNHSLFSVAVVFQIRAMVSLQLSANAGYMVIV